jgi:hypothetical protein
MPSVSINFVQLQQQQDLWCWAAVTASVSSYYGLAIAQCMIVNNQTGETTCCSNGATSRCDQPGYLGVALAALSMLTATHGQVSTADLVAEMSQGRPVGARYEWAGGDAHVFTIIGADDASGTVRIDDPFYGRGDFSMGELRSNYRNFPGTWTHTYFTNPIPGIVWTHTVMPFLAFPPPTRLGVRTGEKALRVPIYDLGTNALRNGAELQDAIATPYHEVIDGESAVEQARDKRGLFKTGAWEDRHDYRTALALLSTGRSDVENFRLLRIPGLYVLALWRPAAGGGRVVPVLPVPRFLESRPYTENEFVSIVRERLAAIAEKRGRKGGGDLSP